MCGGWRQFQFLEGQLVRSRALSSHTSTTIRRSTRLEGLDADSLGCRLVPIPAQHRLSPAICRPNCPNSAIGEGSQRLGVAQWPFLCLSSLSRLGEYSGLVNAPLKVPNPVEDKAVRLVAPTSEADDTIPPAKVLPGRPDGVSSVCWNSRRLLRSLLRVSLRTDGMAGNTYVWSGHVHS